MQAVTTRTERKILRRLIRHSLKGQNVVSFDDLKIKDKFYPYDLEKKELIEIIGTGLEDEYGKFQNYNHAKLTEKGRHYFSFQWEEIKLFLFKSVLVPIVVSIITTILALLIRGVLRQKLSS